MMMQTYGRKDYALAIGVPVAFLFLTFILEQVFGAGCFTACEDGPVENLQALNMFAAFLIGVSIIRMKRGVFPDWVRAWFMAGTLASLYIALEEISYGQRIFGWMTPDTWQAVNDQNETNLHNASSWLDQKPRAILEIGVYVGGLIIPALRLWKPSWLPTKWAAIYPPSILFVTAAIALLIRLYESGMEFIGRQDLFLIDRGSELQESYFNWFVFLYLLFMRRQYRS